MHGTDTAALLTMTDKRDAALVKRLFPRLVTYMFHEWWEDVGETEELPLDSERFI